MMFDLWPVYSGERFRASGPSSFSFQIWILCQNSLTRELKIRVVGFALQKLFTHFEILIVSHALHCVNGHYCVFYLF